MDKNILIARLTGEFKSLRPNSINLEISTFDEIERVHDWRNCIPDEIRELWNELSVESRLVAAIIAELWASEENWE